MRHAHLQDMPRGTDDRGFRSSAAWLSAVCGCGALHRLGKIGSRSGVVNGNDLSINSGRFRIIENGGEIDFHVGIP